MNLEELKLILDVVQQAGDGAFWLAILYMAGEWFSTILVFIGVMIPVWLSYKVGVGAYKSYNSAHKICDALGVNFPYYESDWPKLLIRVEKMVRVEKEKR